MSKHPEKFIKDKELIKEISKEKEIKEQKEHKEKEFKEHKDKPEKEHKEKDIKEHKDKPEKEIKEIIKDYKEVKEFKEIEKIQKDKDIEKIQKDKDKDAETQPGGDPIQPLAAIHKFHGKEHIEKTHKDVDKVQKDKDFEFSAQAAAAPPQPAPPMQAAAKFTDKTIEKTLHKDFDKVFIKDKEFKHEKLEKIEWKELVKEIKEWDVAGPVHVGPGDPVEQRIAVLEATVAQLMHFIPQELRPDLSAGALAAEKHSQGGKAATGTPDKSAKEANQADKEKK
jgi:hypothetical protein